MQQNEAGRLKACALRICRLDPVTYVPLVGASNAYVTSLITLSATPEVEAGPEFLPKNACGGFDFLGKDADLIKRWTLALAVNLDGPEFREILTGAPLITASEGGRTIAATTTTTGSPNISSVNANFTSTDVGRGVTGTGIPGAATILSVTNATNAVLSANATASGSVVVTVANSTISIGNVANSLLVANNAPVSIELWARAQVGSAQDSYRPWWRYAFPLTYWRSTNLGDFANAVATPDFTGFALENPNWGNGPFNDWVMPAPSTVSLTQVWGRFRDTALPATAVGYVTVPAAA